MADKSLRFLIFGEDKGAGAALEDVATKAEGVGHRMLNAFGQVSSYIGGPFGEAIGNVQNSLQNLDDGKEKHSWGERFMAGGGAIMALGAGLQMLGAGAQQAQAQLAQAIKNTGGNIQTYQGEIDSTVHSMEDYGHSAEDTKGALTQMTQATGSPTKALREMGLVANLAASQHVSLTQAANEVDKIMSGKGSRTLAEYGITMGKSKDKTLDAQIALDELSKKINGQASAAVDNFRGKVDIIKAKLGDWAADTAAKVGPAITALGPVMMGVGAVMESGLVPKLVGLTAKMLGFGAQSTATAAEVAVGSGEIEASEEAVAATSEETGAATTLAFGPIGLAIAALIVVALLLWKHWHEVWGWVKDDADDAWHFIDSHLVQPFERGMGDFTHAVADVWDWISGHWPLLLAILTGPIGLAVLWIKDHWSQVLGFFTGLPAAIGNVLSSVVGFITSPFRAAFDAVANLWNGTIGRLHVKLPSWIPGIGGKGFDMPQIPLMAAGGIVTEPTLLIAGEAGPEAIVPLSHGGGLGGASGGTTIVNINVPAGMLLSGTPLQLAQQIQRLLANAKGQGVLMGLS